MKYCGVCRLNIENTLEHCPLCGAFTEDAEGPSNDDFPVVTTSFMVDVIKHMLLFGAIAGTLICMFINFFVVGLETGLWSVIAGVSSFYIYFSCGYLMKKRMNLGVFSVMEVFLVSIVVLVIDFSLGWKGWSIDYVIPFLIISGSMLMVIVSIFRPFRWKEYMIYVLITALMGLIPVVFILTGWTKVPVVSEICVLYSLLTVTAMAIFSRRKLKAELRRRLHF